MAPPLEQHPIDKGVLGQKVDAPDVYSPGVLFPVPRMMGRSLLGLAEESQQQLPFEGEDVWNCYELSWLASNGVPRRSVLELRVPCNTPNIVESKSLKLYLNSLSFKRFDGVPALLATITADVWRVLGGPLAPLATLLDTEPPLLDPAVWTCVDDAEVGEVPPEGLDAPDETLLRGSAAATDAATATAAAKGTAVSERLVSHVLRTLCPVTGQPDWGSVLIEYHGPPIGHAGVLRYICSLRREVGFHENAVERVYLALRTQCAPEALRVTGRFFRRGGIDINPVRATANAEVTLGKPAPQLRVPGQ